MRSLLAHTHKETCLFITQSCHRGLPMLVPSREALVTATSPHLSFTGVLWSIVLAISGVYYEAHARTHDADFGCRDSAAWCPYCQKVWLQLEEKEIPYVIEKINMRCYGDKPAAYTAKVRQSAGSTLQLALQCLLACLIWKLFSRQHVSRTLALLTPDCIVAHLAISARPVVSQLQTLNGNIDKCAEWDRLNIPGTQSLLHMQLALYRAARCNT